MEGQVLRTERLELHPTAPEMFDGLWSAIEMSLPELSLWMHWAIELDRDVTLEFLAKAAEAWESGADRHFTIFKDGEACGQCSLDHVDHVQHSGEMGYWMRSDLCGQGLMTEAATAVVRFGFWQHDLHRIELHAGVDNTPSVRVAEKLGFQREGMLRHGGRGRDGYHDAYCYGLLVTDQGVHST